MRFFAMQLLRFTDCGFPFPFSIALRAAVVADFRFVISDFAEGWGISVSSFQSNRHVYAAWVI